MCVPLQSIQHVLYMILRWAKGETDRGIGGEEEEGRESEKNNQGIELPTAIL